jgi:hypothetical protein
MVLAVMIAAEVVVVSVAVLACLPFKFLLSWLNQPHEGFSQHRRFDFIARRAKVHTKFNSACHHLKAKKTGYAARIFSGGRYDTGR